MSTRLSEPFPDAVRTQASQRLLDSTVFLLVKGVQGLFFVVSALYFSLRKLRTVMNNIPIRLSRKRFPITNIYVDYIIYMKSDPIMLLYKIGNVSNNSEIFLLLVIRNSHRFLVTVNWWLYIVFTIWNSFIHFLR